MILDALLKVSAAQQVTADAVSGNTVDMGNVTPKRKIGVGTAMAYVVAITAIGTNSGSAKLTAITSAAAALTSPLIIGELDLATADIAVGKVYVIAISHGIAFLRYHGINYDITGTVDFTVDAYGPMPMAMASSLAENYSKGYVVS